MSSLIHWWISNLVPYLFGAFVCFLNPDIKSHTGECVCVVQFGGTSFNSNDMATKILV